MASHSTMPEPEPNDLPGVLARALDAVDEHDEPKRRCEQAMGLLNLLLVHVSDVLDAEYSAWREEHEPDEAVEAELEAAGSKPRSLGTRWDVAWAIWKHLDTHRVDHGLVGVPTGKDNARTPLAELSAVWEVLKRAWAATEDDEARAKLPYAHLVRGVQARVRDTGLCKVVATVINHRNGHAHGKEGFEVAPGVRRVLSFSEGYYEVMAPLLDRAARNLCAGFFGPLAGRAILTVTQVDKQSQGHVYRATRDLGLGKPRKLPGAPCPLGLDMVSGSRWVEGPEGRPHLRLLEAPLEPHDPAPKRAASAGATPRSRVPGPAFTVPFPSKQDHFVGRDEDLAYLHAQLTEGQRTLIGQAASIHGMGGVGKTQLAVEYAHRYRDSYPDGVVWLDTTQPRRAVLAGLATEALGGRPDDKPENHVAQAWHWLNTHPRCLLVLDNLGEDTKLDAWIPAARTEEGPRILATSRHRLGPEWSSRSLDRLDRPAAVDLLRHTTGSSNDARCTDAEADALCERLCDYPLAIEIAGRYLHRYAGVTVTEYIEDLEARGVRRLSANGHLAATQHRACVVATLALNRERLADRAPVLAVVERMATWPSRRVAEDLLHLVSEIPNRRELKEALSEAWNLSLLQRGEDEHADERVVRIHPFMQEVVREELGRETVEEHRTAWRHHAREWLAEHRDRGRTGRVQDHAEALHELCGGEGPDPDAACILRELAHHAEIGGQPQEAEELLAAARSRWSHELEPLEAVRLDLVETKVALLRGRPGDALGHVERSERVLRNAATEHPRLWARTLALKAWGQRDGGEPGAAHATAERANRFAEQRLGAYPEDQARALSDLGVTTSTLGRNAEALKHFTRALETRTDRFGEEHPDVALALANLAGALQDVGRSEEALDRATRALEIRTRAFGDEHPDVAHSHDALGSILHDVQRDAEALEHATRALEIRARIFGEEHPEVARAHISLGATLHNLQRYAEAIEHKTRGLDIQTRVCGEEHPSVAYAHGSLGATLFALKRYEEALRHEQRELDIQIRIFGAEHPLVAKAHENVGGTFFALERYEEALRQAQHQLDIQTQVGGETSAGVALAHRNVGAALHKLGRDQEALERLRASERILEALPNTSPDQLARVRRMRKAVSQALKRSRPGSRQISSRTGGAPNRARSMRKKARRKSKKKR